MSSRRVRFETPAHEVVEVELQPGERCVVGREPPEAPATQRVAVDDPSVSTAHLEVRATAEGLAVRDLGSRNGSLLRVPVNAPLQLLGNDARLLLGASTPEPGDEAGLRPVRWTTDRSFELALIEEIEPWLRARGVAAVVAVIPPTGLADRDDPGVIPLATRGALQVRFTGTVDARWRQFLKQVWSFVDEQNAVLKAERALQHDGVVLESPAARAAHRAVLLAAQKSARLVLMGPSGAGKEALARAYHRHRHPEAPFVALNCSLFRKDLLHAQLFGAEAGSFTGATHRLVGAVERASGGTLFLDELGELEMELQPALLRFLDSGEFERLGAPGVVRRAEVRVVCATNQDLRSRVSEGHFRADLWYRLAGRVVDVPGLEERPEDLVAFLNGSGGRAPLWQRLESEARDLLMRHPWPGNFRELSTVASQLAELGPRVSVERCAEVLRQSSVAPARPTPPRAPPTGFEWSAAMQRALAAFEEDHGQAPRDWADVKELLEQYLKPLAFVGLSGATASESRLGPPGPIAHRVGADRGTGTKQLTRFLERFAGS